MHVVDTFSNNCLMICCQSPVSFMKYISLSKALYCISSMLIFYTLLQLGFSSAGAFTSSAQEEKVRKEEYEIAALQDKVDTLYQKSMSTQHESFLTSVMNSIGYTRKGEQIYIFPKDTTADIPERKDEVIISAERTPASFLLLLGRPIVSFILSGSLTAGLCMIGYIISKKRVRT